MIITSKTYIAIPPGETIKEQLSYRGITQKEFALRMELSEKHTSKLINGSVILTPNVAFKLELVLGISSTFWLNLEAIYREDIIKATEENKMEAEIEICKRTRS